jgi:transcription elongation factor GreA-like protein
MSLKLHFLASHLDYFPPNLVAVSEEQGERFHQDLKDVKRRYQERWNVNMMADYCWSIVRDDPSREHTRTSRIQILREREKGDRGILTYISKECNVSKLSTHAPFTLLAKLFYLCVISLFSACVILYLKSET